MNIAEKTADIERRGLWLRVDRCVADPECVVVRITDEKPPRHLRPTVCRAFRPDLFLRPGESEEAGVLRVVDQLERKLADLPPADEEFAANRGREAN